MKKTLLLLAGYPGTGKTYFADMFLSQYPNFHSISQDTIKEDCFDEYGFTNLKEKEKVVEISRRRYYDRIEEYMRRGQSIISDYPFSYKQKPIFENLIKQYEYQAITIRFKGDIHVIFERQRKRDLDPSRHLGHMAISYQMGDTVLDRSLQGDLVTFEKLVKRGTDRGYHTFTLGHLIEIDTTDFNNVNYAKIFDEISSWIKLGEKKI